MQQLALEIALALLGMPKRGDVLERAVTAQAAYVVIEHALAFAPHDPLGAVGADDAIFERVGCDAGELAVAMLLEARAILGMDKSDQRVVAGDGVGRLKTEDVIKLIGPFGLAGGDVVLEAADCGEALRPRELLVAVFECDLVTPGPRDAPELEDRDCDEDQRE